MPRKGAKVTRGNGLENLNAIITRPSERDYYRIVGKAAAVYNEVYGDRKDVLRVWAVQLIPESNTHRFQYETHLNPEWEHCVYTGDTYRPPPTPGEPMPLPEAEFTRETAKNGWLDPEGRFYACQYHGHNRLSYLLCLHKGLREHAAPDDRYFDNDNERALEEHGYIKLSWPGGKDASGMWMFSPLKKRGAPMMLRQRDTIVAWCAALNQRVPYDVQQFAQDEEEGFSLL